MNENVLKIPVFICNGRHSPAMKTGIGAIGEIKVQNLRRKIFSMSGVSRFYPNQYLEEA
jgi:hypothetical protein